MRFFENAIDARRKQPEHRISRFEKLEERRLLFAGSFQRIDSILGYSDAVSSAYAEGSAFDSTRTPESVDLGPLFDPRGGEEIAKSAAGGNAVNGGARATAIGTSLAQVFTPIQEFVDMPTVNLVSQQIVSTLGYFEDSSDYGNAWSLTETYTTLSGAFQYNADSPNQQDLFIGGVSMVGIGGGVTLIPQSRWRHTTTMNLQIWQNGNVLLADIWAWGFGEGSYGSPTGPEGFPGYTEWYLSASINGQDPIVESSTQLNAFIALSAALIDGDIITFEGFVESDLYAIMEPWPVGSYTAQAVFGQAINAFGFADIGTANLPTSVFLGPPAPGDLDGNGLINDTDSNIWAEDFDNQIGYLSDGDQAILIVTTEEDVADGDYSYFDLSLREAIELASDVNHPGHDTVVFAPWVNNIPLTDTLVINSDVAVLGPGASELAITGGGIQGVLEVGNTVKITDLTISGGDSVGYGGGIVSMGGNLTIERVVIENNTNAGDGAGIYMEESTLTIIDSTIDANTGGGGIHVLNTELTIIGSTISNNTGFLCGGLGFFGNAGQLLTIANSTISGNTGTYAGGLLFSGYSSYSGQIVNCTIANNVAANGGTNSGGVLAFGGNLVIHNSIVATNRHANNSTSDILAGGSATFDSESSHNLIGFDDITGNNLDDGNDYNQVGGEGTDPAIDPMLDVLDDYGGATKTHALLTGSLAINAGDDDAIENFGLAYDQRGIGFDRRIGTADIGAFEYNSAVQSAAARWLVLSGHNVNQVKKDSYSSSNALNVPTCAELKSVDRFFDDVGNALGADADADWVESLFVVSHRSHKIKNDRF